MYQPRLDLRIEGEPQRPQQPRREVPQPAEKVDPSAGSGQTLSEFQGLVSPWGEVGQPSGSPVHSVPVEVFRAILKGEVTSWEDRPGLDYGDHPPTVIRLGVAEYPGWPVLAVSVVIPLEKAEKLPGGRMRYTWSYPNG
jgi:hypothetical protein